MLMPSIFGENMFDDFFDGFFRPAKATGRYNIPSNDVMRTDVKELDHHYELEINLPGYKKEDVQAELKDGYLTITASTNSSTEEKDENGKYIRRERYVGSCSRNFYVGEQVTEQDVQAKFEDGILKLTVPKKEAAPQIEDKKYIEIS